MKDLFYEQIKNNLIEDEAYSRVKDYSKERHRVITYFENGRLLSEAGKHYGKGIIKNYSIKLMNEVNRKYNERTLRRMRQFYSIFKGEKWSTLSTILTWSHYSELLSIKNINEIMYYVSICQTQNIGVRLLREKIKNKEYERLPKETKNKLISNTKTEVLDMIPDPILINNNKNIVIYHEKELKEVILENIVSFMKELGIGYTFVDSEYQIKIGNTYHYIDILLFNYKFNCFVVVELKITEFKVEYMSQIKKYMKYMDENKDININNTIGIIVCKKENKLIINYCYDDDKIAIREYEIV